MDIEINEFLELYRFAITGDCDYLNGTLLNNFKQKEMVDFSIYRGLYLPTEILNVGSCVEEWNGCSHWTSNEEIAKKFLAGYEAEEYVEEYGLEHGTDGSFEEGFKLFSKVLMKITSPKDVLPVGRLLDYCNSKSEVFKTALLEDEFDSNNTLEDIIAEDEFSLFGYNFEIKSIQKNDDIYYIDVIQVERSINLNFSDFRVDDIVYLSLYDSGEGNAVVRSVEDDKMALEWINCIPCYPCCSPLEGLFELSQKDIDLDLICSIELLERNENNKVEIKKPSLTEMISSVAQQISGSELGKPVARSSKKMSL